jgi:hypothetical protein
LRNSGTKHSYFDAPISLLLKCYTENGFIRFIFAALQTPISTDSGWSIYDTIPAFALKCSKAQDHRASDCMSLLERDMFPFATPWYQCFVSTKGLTDTLLGLQQNL